MPTLISSPAADVSATSAVSVVSVVSAAAASEDAAVSAEPPHAVSPSTMAAVKIAAKNFFFMENPPLKKFYCVLMILSYPQNTVNSMHILLTKVQYSIQLRPGVDFFPNSV